MNEVTGILEALNQGKPTAADLLLPLVYDELRRLAAQKMAREANGHSLQPTALVHQAYLRLVDKENEPKWENRGHFYAAAAEAMRRILIEAARRRNSLKRTGSLNRIELTDELGALSEDNTGMLFALDEALQKLKLQDHEAYQVVMLRYFGGLTVTDCASSMNLSERTIKRNWAFARAWLQSEIERE
jgi:RNA polymerase sigma factor (TIGR02999 family)